MNITKLKYTSKRKSFSTWWGLFPARMSNRFLVTNPIRRLCCVARSQIWSMVEFLFSEKWKTYLHLKVPLFQTEVFLKTSINIIVSAWSTSIRWAKESARCELVEYQWGTLRNSEDHWGTLRTIEEHWWTLRTIEEHWGILRTIENHWGTLRTIGEQKAKEEDFCASRCNVIAKINPGLITFKSRQVLFKDQIGYHQ